jgi:hypothetical protein
MPAGAPLTRILLLLLLLPLVLQHHVARVRNCALCTVLGRTHMLTTGMLRPDASRL